MSQSQRKLLRRLQEAGSKGVPASAVPSGCRRLLADLETCGAIGRQMVGRGNVICIQNQDAFGAFVLDRYPLGLDPLAEEVADRASGVRLLGDAKAAKRGSREGVFIRSMRSASLCGADGARLPVAELTAVSGGAAILLGDHCPWSFRGVVALVENAEAFWQHELELPEPDLAICTCGRASERLLAWLSSDQMVDCTYIHWPDYDPVGCLEYLRIRDRCGERVTMHLPGRVRSLLPVYGKRSLITQQLQELDAVRRRCPSGPIAELVELFDEHRRGLEQEVLLLGQSLDQVTA